jgi:hypothetical protein
MVASDLRRRGRKIGVVGERKAVGPDMVAEGDIVTDCWEILTVVNCEI